MSEQAPADKSQGRDWAWWLAALMGGVLFYVLSPGVLRILDTKIPEVLYPVIGVIYMPLEWLYNNVELIQAAYDWYFSWFNLPLP